MHIHEPRLATEEELRLVHTGEYLEAVRSAEKGMNLLTWTCLSMSLVVKMYCI